MGAAGNPDLRDSQPAGIAVPGIARLDAPVRGLAVPGTCAAVRVSQLQNVGLIPIGDGAEQVVVPLVRHVVADLQREGIRLTRPVVVAPGMISRGQRREHDRGREGEDDRAPCAQDGHGGVPPSCVDDERQPGRALALRSATIRRRVKDRKLMHSRRCQHPVHDRRRVTGEGTRPRRCLRDPSSMQSRSTANSRVGRPLAVSGCRRTDRHGRSCTQESGSRRD